MCCYASKKAKADLLKSFGRRKTMVMWKQIRLDGGRARFANYQYGPGVHVAKTKAGKPWKGRYDACSPRGIHVYCGIPECRCAMVAIPVIVHKGDLICAGWGQAVFSIIRITPKAWREAGIKVATS